MLKSLLIVGLATLGCAVEGRSERDHHRDRIPAVIPNSGWKEFPTRNCNATTLHTRVDTVANITVRGVSPCGYRYAIFVDDVFLGKTSEPECHVFNRRRDVLTFGQWAVNAGRHRIDVIPIQESDSGRRRDSSVFEIRVDTCNPAPCPTPCPCPCPRPCPDPVPEPLVDGDFAFINQRVPRCQAEEVCKARGLHLANVNSGNFLKAVQAAFKGAGPNAQVWIDDWNGDKYVGTCIVLSTGSAPTSGAINVPECCSAPLPVLCQKDANSHPVVEYSCSACQQSSICNNVAARECVNCEFGICKPSNDCGRCFFGEADL